MYKWSDVKNLINDRIRDDQVSSDLSNELTRACNSVLDDINAGLTGDNFSERNQPQVGFNFQTEIISVSFVKGTSSYTFSSLGIDESTYKFPNDLRINSDEDEIFSLVSLGKFKKEVGVNSSNQKMYAVGFNGNTQTLYINHDTTETLDFEVFTTDMVKDDDGSTRKAHLDDTESDNTTFLIPDRFIPNVLVNLTLAEMYGIVKGYQDETRLSFLNEGRNALRGMINSIGIYEKKPVERLEPRPEMSSAYRPRRLTRR